MAEYAAELRKKAFDREVEVLERDLADPNLDATKIVQQINVVHHKAKALFQAQAKVVDAHLIAKEEEKFLEAEKQMSAYQIELDTIERKVNEVLAPDMTPVPPPSDPATRVNLPQLKMQEFNGDIRQWLRFWAGFEEIHNNVNLSDGDKFQYLLQCIPAQSQARKCIEGFPVSGKNYKNAVDALKKTYGRETTLVKVYIRDLLQLVTKNASDKTRLDILELVPTLISQIRNLEELGVTSDKCEMVLYPIIESCLPDDVLQAWQRNPSYAEKLEGIVDFLNTEVQNKMERSLARVDFSAAAPVITEKNENKFKKPKMDVPTASALMATSGESTNGKNQRHCVFCDGKKHASWKCRTARNQMTLKERQDILKKKQLCFCCLRAGHRSSECQSNVVCRSCKGKHYEIMCRGPVPEVKTEVNQTMMAPNYAHQEQGYYQYNYQPQYHHQQSQFAVPQAQVSGTLPLPQQTQQASSSKPVWSDNSKGKQATEARPKIGFSNISGKKQVVMLSMLVFIESHRGLFPARIFIDEGSEESYIKEDIALIAQCPIVGNKRMQHQLFGGVVTKPKQHKLFQVTLRNINGSTTGRFIFNSVPQIAQSIMKPNLGKWLSELQQQGVELHDQSNATDEVQLLVGLDIATQIWTGRSLRLDSYLLARETIFGWVVGGTLKSEDNDQEVITTTTQMVTTMMLNNLNVEDLWSLETIGITDEARTQTRQDLEAAAVAHFEETVTRYDDGRYECRLPYIDGRKKLMSNKPQAMARLHSLTRSLRAEGFLEDYHKIFLTWLEDGIIEQVPEGKENEMEYFLPHRHVIKENSTTPVRPVFDASSKAKGSPSLNECLEKGPNMLEMIPAVMTRFRLNRIGQVADIKKAFLQISIHEEDRNVLQFLWWEDVNCKKIQIFRHKRAVFGVTSSPFLLAATIRYHILNNTDGDSKLAKELLHSFYVDNSVSSHSTEEDADRFQQYAVELLADAKMDLRGWERGPSMNYCVVPVLGMKWELQSDTLALSLEGTRKKLNGAMTKRGLLSAVNAVFDPMGFALPFTIVLKFLFQRCCEMDLKWDDPLPEEIEVQFNKWKAEVPLLENMKVPRWMCSLKNTGHISFHVFSDASCAAFSSCLFIRTESVHKEVNVQLVMCRSRVAPSKKKVTIPRLELLGCLIGVRLAADIKKYLNIPDVECHYWTDSSNALAWIVRDKQWSRFVMNRVMEIRRNTSPEEWSHVPGDENPADLPSRGCGAERLLQLQWWEGPAWLRKPKKDWPKSVVTINEDVIMAEVKKQVVSAHAKPKNHGLLGQLQRFSNYHTMLRVLSLVVRYLTILKKQAEDRKRGNKKKLQLNKCSEKVEGSSVEELVKAEMYILRLVQQESFIGESDDRLKSLGVFSDGEGMLRVKSQLYFGEDVYEERCPIVLPGKHEVVKAIIMMEHAVNSHAGVQTTLAILRKKFWILKARKAVSGVVGACPHCRRYVAKRCEVPETPLPHDRIRHTTAFNITGVDLLGPLILYDGEKVWVVLFTCAVYRCVHLEITPTLSTEGFLRAFRRFVARRGRPSKIYSDNGLNFVGCHNLFSRLDWEQVRRYAAVHKMEWMFNPPTASWWGGFWERLVGLTKQLLRRILGKRVVAMEEMQTILCDVEATLNQRPLTYMGSKDSLEPLCPSHFMRDNGSSDLPEADIVDEKLLRGSARRCQDLREQLRHRFRKEYLGQLQYQSKSRDVSLSPGDVVIIEHDDKKRIDWPLGIIKELYQGRDERIRTALVKTKDGEYLRPLQRLFLMESALSNRKTQNEESVSGGNAQKDSCVQITRSGRKVVQPDRLAYN